MHVHPTRRCTSGQRRAAQAAAPRWQGAPASTRSCGCRRGRLCGGGTRRPTIRRLQSLLSQVGPTCIRPVTPVFAAKTMGMQKTMALERRWRAAPAGSNSSITCQELSIIQAQLSSGARALLAAGGRGGRGNASFKTGRNTAPAIAEHGEAGIGDWLDLELRLVADVGIVGVPNAGKSTLLSVVGFL